MASPLGEIILERARVLGEEGRPLSLRDISRLTEKFTAGPISHTTLSDYVRGAPKKPAMDRLMLLADALAGRDIGSGELFEKFAGAVQVVADSGNARSIDIAEVRLLEHTQRRLVEDLIRAFARANVKTSRAPDVAAADDAVEPAQDAGAD